MKLFKKAKQKFFFVLGKINNSNQAAIIEHTIQSKQLKFMRIISFFLCAIHCFVLLAGSVTYKLYKFLYIEFGCMNKLMNVEEFFLCPPISV